MQGSHDCDVTIIVVEGNKIKSLTEVTRSWELAEEDNADGGSHHAVMRNSIHLKFFIDYNTYG
jgi:hypothetical protein